MANRLVVDADELKKWIKTEVHVKDLSDGFGLCRIIFADDFERAMSRFPGESLEVVPVRRGYRTTTDTLLGRCCVCSVCGSCPDMEYKYCPYCGSLMDGGADNVELDCDKHSYRQARNCKS